MWFKKTSDTNAAWVEIVKAHERLEASQHEKIIKLEATVNELTETIRQRDAVLDKAFDRGKQLREQLVQEKMLNMHREVEPEHTL